MESAQPILSNFLRQCIFAKLYLATDSSVKDSKSM